MRRRYSYLGVISFILLAASCLWLVTEMEVFADDPPELDAIPNHRVGHASNMDRLDLWVAQDPANNDPLSGNYHLGRYDQIAVMWRDDEWATTLHTRVMKISDDLMSWELVSNMSGDITTNETGKVTAAAVNWSGTGDDLLTYFREPYNGGTCTSKPGCMSYGRYFVGGSPVQDRIAVGGGGGMDTFPVFLESDDDKEQEQPGPATTGDFDGDHTEELVVGLWNENSRQGQLFVFDGDWTRPAGTWTVPDNTNQLELVTGDYNGDGRDELVVLSSNQVGGGLSRAETFLLEIFSLSKQGSDWVFTRQTSKRWKESSKSYQLPFVATAEVDPAHPGEELVLYYSLMEAIGTEGVINPHLQLGKVSSDLQTLDIYADTVVNLLLNPYGATLEAADFDFDGIDEIVVMCPTVYGETFHGIHLFALNESGNLARVATYNGDDVAWNSVGTIGSLAIADLNRDLVPEIVEMYWKSGGLWGNPTTLTTQVLAVSQSGGGKWEFVPKMKAEGLPGAGGPATGAFITMKTGDFTHESIRVGEPTYWEFEDVNEMLAVIKEPPKHLDVFMTATGPITYDVNVSGNPAYEEDDRSYSDFETKTSQATDMSSETTNSWDVSGKVGAGIKKLIGASINASYGQDFSHKTAHFKSTEFGSETQAIEADVIWATVTDYHMWEYPVLTDSGTPDPGQTLVVIWPKLPPGCSAQTTCDDPSTHRMYNGDNHLLLGYWPDHENHNLLSYRDPKSTYIDELLFRGDNTDVGSNPDDQYVTYTDIKSTKATTQSTVKVGAEIKGSPTIKQYGMKFGIKASLSGDYSHSQINTHELQYKEETSLRLHITPLVDTKYRYSMQPIWYWHTNGALVMDYHVDIPMDPPEEPGTWWQKTYPKPDPALRLSWKYDSDPEWQQRCRELSMDPSTVKAGEVVSASVRVHNYSWHPVDNVEVQFYDGDPNDGGTKIGGSLKIGTLLDRADVEVETTFLAPSTPGVHHIYAWIDPEGKLDEVHTENNLGYAPLVVTDGTAHDAQASLWVDDLEVSAPRSLGDACQIDATATLKAEYSLFTFVPVYFYAGDYYSSDHSDARLVDGELVTLVAHTDGGGVQVEASWDCSDLCGRQEFWVEVQSSDGQTDIYSHDNRHVVDVELAPCQFYLPLISR